MCEENENIDFENFLSLEFGKGWTKRRLWDADFASRDMFLFEFLDEEQKYEHILFWQENNKPKFKTFKTEELDVKKKFRRRRRAVPLTLEQLKESLTAPTWYSSENQKFFTSNTFSIHEKIAEVYFDHDFGKFFFGIREGENMKLLLRGQTFPEPLKPLRIYNSNQVEQRLLECAFEAQELTPWTKRKFFLKFRYFIQFFGLIYLKYIDYSDKVTQAIEDYWRHSNSTKKRKFGYTLAQVYALTIGGCFCKLPLELISVPPTLVMHSLFSQISFAILFPIFLEIILVSGFPQASYCIFENSYTERVEFLEKSFDLQSPYKNMWAVNCLLSEKSKFNFRSIICAFGLNAFFTGIYIFLLYWYFYIGPSTGEGFFYLE